MKNYQKPTMLVLSLSANDHLCGNCDYNTREHKDELLIYKDIPEVNWIDANNDGVLQDGESKIYGSYDQCSYKLGAYCKFMGTEGYISVFTS